jgi:hypothetical protein
VADSDGLTFGAAVISSILAFAGWFVWGVYSGIIVASTASAPDAVSYSTLGLGLGLSFTAAAIVFWAMLMASGPEKSLLTQSEDLNRVGEETNNKS